jgi:hypothetical protein
VIWPLLGGCRAICLFPQHFFSETGGLVLALFHVVTAFWAESARRTMHFLLGGEQ